MTALLIVAALLTAAVIGFAACVSVQVSAARRDLQIEREVRRRLRPDPAYAEDASDPADCLQAWLDDRWKQHYG